MLNSLEFEFVVNWGGASIPHSIHEEKNIYSEISNVGITIIMRLDIIATTIRIVPHRGPGPGACNSAGLGVGTERQNLDHVDGGDAADHPSTHHCKFPYSV